jgi:FMN reductase
MSVMSLANSLMLDFRCYIIPKFVFATKSDFEEDKIVNSDIKSRIKELGSELIRVSKALN